MSGNRDVALWICAGRAFQRDGAATLKAPSPKVQSLVWGTESRPASEGRRFRGGVCGWRRSERYWGARGMEGFVGEEEDFICDAGLNWESFGHTGAFLGFCWGPQTGLRCSSPNGRL